MFLLYHSKGCNICKPVLRKCYVNNLYTTTCSGVLGHRSQTQKYSCLLVLNGILQTSIGRK
jgi:hypothetical protein